MFSSSLCPPLPVLITMSPSSPCPPFHGHLLLHILLMSSSSCSYPTPHVFLLCPPLLPVYVLLDLFLVPSSSSCLCPPLPPLHGPPSSSCPRHPHAILMSSIIFFFLFISYCSSRPLPPLHDFPFDGVHLSMILVLHTVGLDGVAYTLSMTSMAYTLSVILVLRTLLNFPTDVARSTV